MTADYIREQAHMLCAIAASNHDEFDGSYFAIQCAMGQEVAYDSPEAVAHSLACHAWGEAHARYRTEHGLYGEHWHDVPAAEKREHFIAIEALAARMLEEGWSPP